MSAVSSINLGLILVFASCVMNLSRLSYKLCQGEHQQPIVIVIRSFCEYNGGVKFTRGVHDYSVLLSYQYNFPFGIRLIWLLISRGRRKSERGNAGVPIICTGGG